MRGPLSPQDLKALATSGQLEPDSLVRQGAAGAWVKAARVKGLFSAAEANAPSPGQAGTSDFATSGGPSALPSLNTLGDLGDLPPVASAASAALPMGKAVAAGVPLGGLPPVGTAIPAGTPVGGAVPQATPLINPTLTASGSHDAVRRDRADPGGRRGMSSVRILSASLVALAFSFAGLCFVLFPIVPIVLGLAGVLLALRGMIQAGRRHTPALVTSAAAALLGLAAAGIGMKVTMNIADPIGDLNSRLGGALTGKAPGPIQPMARTSLLHWHEAPNELAQTGDLQIQITGASVGPLPGRADDSKIYLMVSVRVQHVGQPKVDYISPSGTVRGVEAALMQDDLGSTYNRVNVGGSAGQLGRESLYPGDVKIDLLVFERPVPNYNHLELTIPGAAFSDTEPVRFKIPRSMVEQDGAGKATVDPQPKRPKVVEIRSEGEDKEEEPESPKTESDAPKAVEPK